jgi:hypothetical protein
MIDLNKPFQLSTLDIAILDEENKKSLLEKDGKNENQNNLDTTTVFTKNVFTFLKSVCMILVFIWVVLTFYLIILKKVPENIHDSEFADVIANAVTQTNQMDAQKELTPFLAKDMFTKNITWNTDKKGQLITINHASQASCKTVLKDFHDASFNFQDNNLVFDVNDIMVTNDVLINDNLFDDICKTDNTLIFGKDHD